MHRPGPATLAQVHLESSLALRPSVPPFCCRNIRACHGPKSISLVAYENLAQSISRFTGSLSGLSDVSRNNLFFRTALTVKVYLGLNKAKSTVILFINKLNFSIG